MAHTDSSLHATYDGPDILPEPRQIEMTEISRALSLGWRDFRRAPAFGLAFSAFYVLGGWIIASVAFAAGQPWWLIPFVLGFPLIAPFAAVGLYEVSRRIEAGEPLNSSRIVRVVFDQRNGQIPSMAVVILLLFLFWIFVARMLFAVFMGTATMTNVSTSTAFLLEGRGLAMLVLGTIVGGAFAAMLFSVTVVGLPLLLEKEVDFITATITSIQAVLTNPKVMAVWAAVIAIWMFMAIAPAFLGLLVVMPVLGHASWHMYRAVMPNEEPEET